MRRPLVFRVLGALAARAPEKMFKSAILFCVSILVYFTRGAIDAAFKRVLAFQGKPAAAETLRRMRAALSERYAGAVYTQALICRDAHFMETPPGVSLEILPALERLRAEGKGVVLAIPHFGDLFAAVTALARAGLPLSVIFLNGQKFRWVEVEKLRFLGLGMAAADALKALGNNEIVMTYDDLDWFPGERTIDLFGAPVYPARGAARLALAAGAPLLPIYSLWRDGGVHVVCDEPIAVEGLSQEEAEARLARSLEKFIGPNPEQWFLFHDIWNLRVMSRRHRAFSLRGRP